MPLNLQPTPSTEKSFDKILANPQFRLDDGRQRVYKMVAKAAESEKKPEARLETTMRLGKVGRQAVHFVAKAVDLGTGRLSVESTTIAGRNAFFDSPNHLEIFDDPNPLAQALTNDLLLDQDESMSHQVRMTMLSLEDYLFQRAQIVKKNSFAGYSIDEWLQKSQEKFEAKHGPIILGPDLPNREGLIKELQENYKISSFFATVSNRLRPVLNLDITGSENARAIYKQLDPVIQSIKKDGTQSAYSTGELFGAVALLYLAEEIQ